MNIKAPYLKQILKATLIAAVCVVVLFANYWIDYFSRLFGAFQAQVDYLQGYNFVLKIVIYMVPILLLMILYKKSACKQNPDFEFFVLAMIIYIILWQLQGISRKLQNRILFWLFYGYKHSCVIKKH